ncbi:MAG: glycerol kinase GlpK [Phycisphaerales bacterium]|nr:glycerol kinase GlpK [Phycisphaerales bacterium]
MSILLALDAGTSSCRTVAFDLDGNIKVVSQQEFQQHYPRPGWVEHDATEIRDVQLQTMTDVLGQLGTAAGDVCGIGVSNQRETVVVWDRRTGMPIHRAIVWQDRRTAAEVARLAEAADVRDLVRDRTGLVMDPYFSASKLRWILDHVEGARAAADAGHLAFGTIECWLLWSLTRGRTHATDASNAARTMLFDISKQCWDDELLRLFDIPPSILPEVVDCAGRFGEIEGGSGLEVTGLIGDQQSALFGQGGLSRGDAKTTYGTGCFLLMNTGDQPARSTQGLLSTVAWRLNGVPTWALEGSVFMGGASIQWLRDGLGIINTAPDVNALAGSVDDSDGVILVPAFAGLGAPYWDAWGRAAILGMTRGTTAAHIARATLEGIALSVRDVLHAMEADSGITLQELRVDGGAAASDLLMQIQADVLDSAVLRPAMLETTAWGAASMAGIGCGVYASAVDAAGHWHLDRRFEPAVDAAKRDRTLRTWARAVDSVRGWAKEDGDAS